MRRIAVIVAVLICTGILYVLSAGPVVYWEKTVQNVKVDRAIALIYLPTQPLYAKDGGMRGYLDWWLKRQEAARISRLVPSGTALAEARSIMEKHRFLCTMVTNSSFDGLRRIDFLQCDYRSAKAEWRIGLIIAGEQVSTVRVGAKTQRQSVVDSSLPSAKP